MKKKFSCSSTALWQVISQTFDFMWNNWLFVLVPFVILEIILLFLENYLSLWMANFVWLILNLFVFNIIITVVYFVLKNKKKQNFMSVAKHAIKKLPGTIVLFVLQVSLLVLAFVILIFVFPENLVFSIICFIVLILAWVWLSIKFFFVNHLYLTTEMTLWESIKAGFAFSSFVWRWVIFGKYFVIIGMSILVLIWWWIIVSFLLLLINLFLPFDIVWELFGSILNWIWTAFLSVAITVFFFAYQDRYIKKTNTKDSLWCAYFGCLISGAFVLLIVVWFVILAWLGLDRAIKNLSTNQNIPLPVAEERNDIEKTNAMNIMEQIWYNIQNKQPWEFSFTVDDINTYLEEMWEINMRKYLYLYEKWDNILHAKFSIPLWEINRSKFKWKFINWDFGFLIGTSKNRKDNIYINLSTWTLNGKQIPEEFRQELSSQNLLKDIYERPHNDSYKIINQIEDISVDWKNITLKTK